MPQSAGPRWKHFFLTLLLVPAFLAGCGGDDPSEVDEAGGNRAPVARAGPDQVAAVGDLVSLDGSASSDPDNDPVAFFWSFLERPAGSNAFLSDPNAVGPTFTVDVPGDFLIGLSVSDGRLLSAQDTVLVTTSMTGENQPPVAAAGFDRQVHVLAPVQLDSSRSFDPEGDGLSFEWVLLSQPPNSSAFLPDVPNPSFTPLVTGEYEILLVVRDSLGQTDSDLVTITAVPVTEEIAPVAIAGRSQIVSIGSVVTLDGSGSFDPQGSPLSFDWRLTGRPENSLAALAQPGTPNPFFTPDLPGEYLAKLTVRNLRGAAVTADQAITVLPSGENVPPVAIIEVDRLAEAGLVVAIDGSRSFDPDGRLLVFAWLLQTPPGSRAELIDAGGPFPFFTPDIGGDFRLQLTVTDVLGGNHIESVVIQVR